MFYGQWSMFNRKCVPLGTDFYHKLLIFNKLKY
jgi:hypothetical protein